MTYIRKVDREYLPVNGHGVVADLYGTGSKVIPAHLRQKLYNMAAKQGVKSPRSLFKSMNTAIVAVQGLVPPGAVKGSRFDVLVSAELQTNVTSLVGGNLWTTELSLTGIDPTLFTKTLAKAFGPIYVNSFGDDQERHKRQNTIINQVIVIGGGVVEEDRNLKLILQLPNYERIRRISDRINEQFEHERSTDMFNTAVPESDSTIRLHVPARYAGNPQYLLNLIRHLYIQGGPNFEVEKARELANVLKTQPEHASTIISAWESLGSTIRPVLREYYKDPDPLVRQLALEAAAKLGDELTTRVLADLANDEDAKLRRYTARVLGHLRHSFRGPKILRDLLNDEDQNVRLQAYESLEHIGDSTIQQTVFRDRVGHIKFILDLVPSDKPLIYIKQSPLPRVVIFDQMLGFDGNEMISLWEDRLMLRRDGDHLMTVFYQHAGHFKSQQPEIRPTVANLVYLMAHRTTAEHDMPGFDLQFGEIANALYSLTKDEHIASALELQINPAAATLSQHLSQQPGQLRPEFGQPNESGGAMDPPTPVESGGVRAPDPTNTNG